MEFVSTERGGRKILYEGYAYLLDRKRDSISYWRCDKRSECKARLTTDHDNIKNKPTSHTHPPDLTRMNVERTRHSIRKLATSSEELCSTIVQNCTLDLPVETSENLPNNTALERMARRKRKSSNATQTQLEKRPHHTFSTDEIYENALDLNFLTTDSNICHLASNQHWLCAPTTSTTGEPLYTVHGKHEDGTTMPLASAIIHHKHSTTYDNFFAYLKSRQCLEPLTIKVDFNKSAINSIQENFPNSNIKGSPFYFEQSLWRKISELGLHNWCNKNPNNGIVVKKFQALSLISPNKVIDAFEELLISLDSDVDDILADFLVYFQITWIGITQAGRRRQPIFPVHLWNIHNEIMRGVELNNTGIKPPVIKQEADDIVTSVACSFTTNQIDSTDNDHRLKEILKDIVTFDNMFFLDVMAHNI